ncbi:MAG: hypothetical protein NZ920_05885 [Aigarchaeota archaeon]|nr:hypothetical protein [Aigarchaeota archaeon]MDW8092637.1 hypothetical protein [Nitrososphaerota archaeon]
MTYAQLNGAESRRRSEMIVETHGEVCRLGYLRIIPPLMRGLNEISLDYLASQLESVSVSASGPIASGLENVPGFVRSRVVARNYITLSQEFDFINRTRRHLGVNGLLYLGLRSSNKLDAIVKGTRKPSLSDLIALNDVEKTFFLNVLLTKDPYMIRGIIGWILERDEFNRVDAMNWIMEEVYPRSLQNVIDSSPKRLKEALMPKLEEARRFKEERMKYTLKIDWIKSSLYAKYRHVAPPRVEWLVDVGLLEREGRGKYRVSNLVRRNADIFSRLISQSKENVTDYLLAHVAPLFITYGTKAIKETVIGELLSTYKTLSQDGQQSVDLRLIEVATSFRLLENNHYVTTRVIRELLNNLMIVYPDKVLVAPGVDEGLEIVKLDIESP